MKFIKDELEQTKFFDKILPKLISTELQISDANSALGYE